MTRRARGGAPSGRRVSMADVARVAGVSPMSVSRVLNDRPGVNDEARARIRQVMEDLGFSPHRAARALASGTSRTVTVMTSDVKLYGYASMIAGVATEAQDVDFVAQVAVLPAGDDEATRSMVQDAQHSSGLVVLVLFDDVALGAVDMFPTMDNVVVIARSASPPDSLLGAIPPERYIWVDERGGAAAATTYLLSLGHETVHHVAIPGWLVNERENGWRTVLGDRGKQGTLARAEGWEASCGHDAMVDLLSRGEPITAVQCGNDSLALGVIRALHEAGLRVPEDVAVVGFDDAPDTAFYTPPLTTVRVDWHALGRVAFRRGYDLMTGNRPVDEVSGVQPRLVVRQSTAAPRRR